MRFSITRCVVRPNNTAGRKVVVRHWENFRDFLMKVMRLKTMLVRAIVFFRFILLLILQSRPFSRHENMTRLSRCHDSQFCFLLGSPRFELRTSYESTEISRRPDNIAKESRRIRTRLEVFCSRHWNSIFYFSQIIYLFFKNLYNWSMYRMWIVRHALKNENTYVVAENND